MLFGKKYYGSSNIPKSEPVIKKKKKTKLYKIKDRILTNKKRKHDYSMIKRLW